MKAWSVIGLLFAAVILATVPVSSEVTRRGSLELTIAKAEATPMGGRAVSRGAWTGATIAMPDGPTGAVTNRAAPFLLYGAYGRTTWPSILWVAFDSDWFAGHK